ncbi:MAG: helix-turn-helix domain-containing protein [Halanaerobiales bacterium]|nr:helix-turn-helix domain-containing protein [Halanaerobiales bacterium]
MKIKLNKLKGLIAQNDMTQRDIASLINVAPNTLSRKMNGKTPFTLPEAKIIADFFGITIDELFFYHEVPNREHSA